MTVSVQTALHVQECVVTSTNGIGNFTFAANSVSTLCIVRGCHEVVGTGHITQYAGCEVLCVLYRIDMVMVVHG